MRPGHLDGLVWNGETTLQPPPVLRIDAFEVQLGAAVLLQFRCPSGDVVRVLADAGVRAPGYSAGHVHRKLPNAFGDFSTAPWRLDLLIGTHYDEDHLRGLVPIIEDEEIKVGEAWLPPVANDTEIHAAEDQPGATNLLAAQFAGSDGRGREALLRYLAAKAKLCRQLANLMGSAERKGEGAPSFGPHGPDDGPDAWRPFFDYHLLDASRAVDGTAYTHADETYDDVPEVVDEQRTLGCNGLDWWGELSVPPNWWARVLARRWKDSPELRQVDTVNLAYLRRGVAVDAINALALADVVAALTRRGVPIRCECIASGVPRRFSWKHHERRFTPTTESQSRAPELLLLGPSRDLVRKHWLRLPVGTYVARLTAASIPLKSLTPSNQLSYVMRFGFEEQGVLVAGDAGFVDFHLGRQRYHPRLLKALLPLHIVQVAHHGGNNAHFYRVLVEAGFLEQPRPAMLILSHATHDKLRPSDAFALFAEGCGPARADGGAWLLFTSEPSRERVKSLLALIHPSVGQQEAVGDIRIDFAGSDWCVRKHAVSITA